MTHPGLPLLQRWFEEAWNEKQESSIDKYVDEDAVFGNLRGREQFRDFYRRFNVDFDVQIKIQDVAVDGDIESGICTIEATHRPTHFKVAFSDEARIQVKDGKIIRAWNNFDEVCYNSVKGLQPASSQS